MTVIAWDGKTLAADKMSVSGGYSATVTKIRKIRGHLVGGSGNAPDVREHMAWFADGADPKTFPERLRDDSYRSFLLVITPERQIHVYETGALPMVQDDPYYAIGSGRDFALAAMHLGFSATRGVEVANHLSSSCGRGVDILQFED
jgi:20S proteasome alpha/beta subunit